MKAKKMLAVLLGIMVLGASEGVRAQQAIKISINNEAVNVGKTLPFLDKNNRTMVPLRLISEKLGMKVQWNAGAQQVTIIKENQTAVLTIGKNIMVVNGQEIKMDTQPIMKNESIYVPVKYIGEALGVVVKWDANTSTVTITEEKAEDPVVVKVNDEVITVSDMKRELEIQRDLIASYQSAGEKWSDEEVEKYINDYKEQAILKTVVYVKGKELKLEPSKAEIDEMINEVRQAYHDEASYIKALGESGFTEESYRNFCLKQLTISKTVNAITDKIEISDAEMNSYYKANISALTYGPGAEMYHILVPTEEEAKKIKAEYDKGTSFEKLAEEYGTDGTKTLGGKLGYIEYDSQLYDKDFLAGAKTLEEGQVSEPVKTQFGWHLIKVTNVCKDKYVLPLDEVKEEIRDAVLSKKKSSSIEEQIEKWQKEMKIEINEDLISKL